MLIPEFVIPLHLDDLADMESGNQICISGILSLPELREQLEAARRASQEEGAEFVVEHFSTFYSLLKKFKECSEPVRQKGLNVLLKSFIQLTSTLNIILEEGNIDSELQQRNSNILKILSYLLVQVTSAFQNLQVESSVLDAKGKKKVAKPAEDGSVWSDEREKVLIEIYNLLQLPLKLLWDPPVVDEEFVNLFSNLCYKCLEDQSISSAACKSQRTLIFQILGTLIKQHRHGLSFCVKVVQLLRMNEHLVTPLAQGVVELVNMGCTSLVREIVREVSEADDQLLNDSSGARHLSQFLATVAVAAPAAAIPAVQTLANMLDRDPPALRCCALTVLGEIVHSTLTKEDLDDALKATRDGHLAILEDHIHDVNAFVRTRALSVWQRLCLAKAIPLARLNRMLLLGIGRLGDKSTNVKKQAVQLIKVLLEGNPYSGQLDVAEIKTQLSNEKTKLNNLKSAHGLEEPSPEEWAALEPKLKDLLEKNLDKEEEEAEEKENALSLQEACSKIGKLLSTGDCAGAVDVLYTLKDEFYGQLGEKQADDVNASLELLKKCWEQCFSVPSLSAEVLERKDVLEKTVSYLEDTLEFALLIDRALPLILTLLSSSVQTDVLEAISFFTAAYQFGFARAVEGVRRMLMLVFSKEAAIKTAVCTAYKQLYFETNLTGRQHSLHAVQRLSELVIQLDHSQLKALQEVIRDWVKEEVIDKTTIQVLFERFSLKIQGTTEAQSWAALNLISMVGAEQIKVIRSNVSVLVNEGLGPRGAKNLTLAQYTCKALQHLTPDSAWDLEDLFARVRRLLRDGMWHPDPYYIPFADEALNLIFRLLERPDVFLEELLLDLFARLKDGKRPVVKQPKGKTLNKLDQVEILDDEEVEGGETPQQEATENNDESDLSAAGMIRRMTRFFSLLASVASHYVGFLDGKVLGELKRRNQIEFERKLRKHDSKIDKTMDTENEDLEFHRVAADDRDASELREISENHIVSGNGLLAKFFPLIKNICTNPGKFPNEQLQNAALLALGNYMQVSSKVCDENIQLLMTITERSQSVEKRRNGLMLLWALQFRFPNTLEPWTRHIFSLLRDPDSDVRRTAVIVLTNLIVNEMVKARSNLADLAACLVDKDAAIAQTIRHFFRELSTKGNALNNVLPGLVANLNVDEEEFQTIMKFLLELISSNKMQECLIEKLCQYFQCATSDRQCRDLAYCLSQMQVNDRSLRKMLENFTCFGSKLYIAEVFETFTNILAAAAKNPARDKNLQDELGSLVQEYRTKTCEDRDVPVTLTKRPPPSTRKRMVRKKLDVSTDEDCFDQFEEKIAPVPRSTRKRCPRRKLVSSDSEAEPEAPMSDDELFIKKKSNTRRQRESKVSSDSDSETVKKTKTTRKSASAKKSRSKSTFIEESDDEELVKQPLRSSRKRR